MNNAHSTEQFADPLWNRAGDAADNATPGARIPISYQVALRAVGAYLDEHQAQRINILEALDSLAVRYQLSLNQLASTSIRLLPADLTAIDRRLEGWHHKMKFRRGPKPTQHSYQNVLRALGYELDEIGAYSILIDEIDEGMMVTYQFLRPSEGFQVRKRMVILGAEAMHAVMSDAEARREQRKKGVITLLAS